MGSTHVTLCRFSLSDKPESQKSDGQTKNQFRVIVSCALLYGKKIFGTKKKHAFHAQQSQQCTVNTRHCSFAFDIALFDNILEALSALQILQMWPPHSVQLHHILTSSTTRSSLRTSPRANVVQLQSSSGSPSPAQRFADTFRAAKLSPTNTPAELLHPHLYPEISRPLSILSILILQCLGNVQIIHITQQKCGYHHPTHISR